MKSKKITAGIKGFTLLEILIALFIFTLLSMILVAALRSVINADAGTKKSAERLRQMQMALLVISRDIEQMVDRPILNAYGKEEIACKGSSHDVTFTHTGFANPTGALLRSTLQRTRYVGDQHALWRMVWPVLDQAPQSQPHSRLLLNDVSDVQFEYLDKENHFHREWPPEEQTKELLPRAIRVTLTILQWGTLSQLYVIPVQANELKPPSASKP